MSSGPLPLVAAQREAGDAAVCRDPREQSCPRRQAPTTTDRSVLNRVYPAIPPLGDGVLYYAKHIDER
jgi:hypothetical protein